MRSMSATPCSSLSRSLCAFGLSLLVSACSSQGGAPPALPDQGSSPAVDMAMGGGPPDLQPMRAFSWLKQLPASDNVDLVRELAVDSAGNLFVACQFAGQTDFGDGPRKSQGNHDIALVKLSSQGELLWVRHVGSPAAEWVLDLAVDAAGNAILAGSFSEPINFGDGPLTSRGRDDYFLAKYSSEGGLKWAKALGGAGIEANNASLAVDPAGNIFLAASFNLGASTGSIDLGGGPLTSAGYSDGFIAKFSPAGDHVFSRRFGGPYLDYVLSLAIDPSGDLIVGGQLGGPVDLGGGLMDPGSGSIYWAFVQRLDADGRHKWAQGYYADGSRITQLAVAPSGAITVAGTYVLRLQTKTASLSSPGTRGSGFLLQLDAAGKEGWARNLVAGSETDMPYALLATGGRLLVGGSFEGSGNLGLGPLTSAGLGDAYLATYSLAGVPEKMLRLGAGEQDWIAALAPGGEALYVGGVFGSSVDFGGQSLTSKGFADGFVMALPAMGGVVP